MPDLVVASLCDAAKSVIVARLVDHAEKGLRRAPSRHRQTCPDFSLCYQRPCHTELRCCSSALGLDGRPALTKRDLRVRFPAGAPHPGAGSQWAGQPRLSDPAPSGLSVPDQFRVSDFCNQTSRSTCKSAVGMAKRLSWPCAEGGIPIATKTKAAPSCRHGCGLARFDCRRCRWRDPWH